MEHFPQRINQNSNTVKERMRLQTKENESSVVVIGFSY